MALLQRTIPNVSIPGLLVPWVQDVDFESYIGKKTNMGSLAIEKAYITTINNINSEVQVGQQWGKSFARQTYTMGQISAPFYSLEAYVEYDLSEQAHFEAVSGGVALPNFLENLAKQGINQRRHEAILHGFDATNAGQGILGNATKVSTPADSNGASTLTGYDTAELAAFLSKCVRDVMDASYGSLKPSVIASSNRVINYLQTAIIPLTESQKDGSGIDSVAGLFNRVVQWIGVGNVKFIKDNRLMNASADGLKDKIVFIAPGLDNQESQGQDSQNLVGHENSITFNTMYDGAEGLMKFDAPPSLGVFASKYRYKMTPGVTLRSEAVVELEIKYA